MNTVQTQQIQNALSSRHLYSKKQLIGLFSGYITSLVVTFGVSNLISSLSGILVLTGLLAFLGLITYVLFIDWRGLLTLNGKLKWGKIDGGEKVFAIFVFVGFSMLVFAAYLVQAYRTYQWDKQQESWRQKRKIAEQEAQLGMLPPTDGTCGFCNKPLQLGAEYCVYCGTVVVQKPRVCSKCLTIALPDARWCPKCGSQLDTTH